MAPMKIDCGGIIYFIFFFIQPQSVIVCILMECHKTKHIILFSLIIIVCATKTHQNVNIDRIYWS